MQVTTPGQVHDRRADMPECHLADQDDPQLRRTERTRRLQITPCIPGRAARDQAGMYLSNQVTSRVR